MLIPSVYLMQPFPALKEGREQLQDSERIFQMIAVKNGGYLKVPKLNKPIKKFSVHTNTENQFIKIYG